MKRMLVGVCARGLVALVVLAALVAGYKVIKDTCRQHGVGPWLKEGSFDSWDPYERVEAARAAARKYGGK